MPYIKYEERCKINNALRELNTALCLLPQPHDGQLNYIFTRLINNFILYHDNYGDYLAYARACGLLECIKLELYRRLVAPYEDRKIQENGDVY